MQRYPAPTACPVCGAQMRVTHLKCDRCQTELTGNFAPCRFCALPEKDLRFIETFLRCRGSIKDVERALGVSYPTVRNHARQRAPGRWATRRGPKPDAKRETDGRCWNC